MARKRKVGRKPDASIGGPSEVEAVKAWYEELLRTGRFVDVTEEALKRGLAGIIITGARTPKDEKPE